MPWQEILWLEAKKWVEVTWIDTAWGDLTARKEAKRMMTDQEVVDDLQHEFTAQQAVARETVVVVPIINNKVAGVVKSKKKLTKKEKLVRASEMSGKLNSWVARGIQQKDDPVEMMDEECGAKQERLARAARQKTWGMIKMLVMDLASGVEAKCTARWFMEIVLVRVIRRSLITGVTLICKEDDLTRALLVRKLREIDVNRKLIRCNANDGKDD